jgi:gas vesicle protein
MSKHDGWIALSWFAAGAAVGAAAALLTAPRSGRETRRMLHDAANEVGHRVAQVPHAAHEACERAAKAARDAFAESFRG